MANTPKRGNRAKTPDSTENVQTSAARARDAENCPIRCRNMDRTPKRGNRQKPPAPMKTAQLAQHVRATLKTGQYVEQTWPIRQNVETGQNRPTPWKTSD